MTPDEIEAFLRLAEAKDLARFEITLNGTSLRLAFDEGETAGQETEPPATDRPLPDVSGLSATPQEARARQAVEAPAVGFFRARHPLDGAEPPAHVEARAPAAFVRSGPLLFAARMPTAGRLGAALVEEGQGVGFGTKLFELA